MSIDKGKAAGLVARKGLSRGAAGTVILAAGITLLGAGMTGFVVHAQTTPPPDTGLSLGIEEPAPVRPAAPPVPVGYTFSAVKIEGNAHVDASTIVSYLGLPKGKIVTDAALNDAYQRLVASGLFARVELVPQRGSLLVKVVENPLIGTIDYQGNARIADADLTKVVTSKESQVYSPSAAEADAAIITNEYRQRGRLAATVTPRIIRRPNNRVDLVFEITEGKVAEIARLSFVGNQAFSDYRLRQVLSTKQAGILHQLIQRDSYQIDRIELDKKQLSDFYLAHGYLDFQILDAGATYARDRDATFLTFTISEGQSFRIGKVSTISEVDGLDAAEFNALNRLKPGATYNPLDIQNNVEALESLALKKGLNFITVEPRMARNDRDGTVDVTFAIMKGQRIFVERIDIEGNTTTLDSVVRRQFHTTEGDPMNAREIAQAAERIRALGFFSDVQVTQEPGNAPDQDVVKVAVTEAPTGSLTLGATYGISSGIGVNIGFAETNFLGRGQGLNVSVQTGTDNVDSRIEFSEPAFLGRDLTFAFAAGYLTTKHQNSNYDTQVISVAPSLAFPVSDFGRLKLSYRIARETVSNVDGAVVDDPMTPIDETSNGSSAILMAEEGADFASSIGYNYTWDDRNSGLHPKGGVSFQFGQNFAGLGGDVKYIQTSVRAVAETKIANGDVSLKASFEGGAITTYGGYVSRVTDRYLGANGIRGFQPDGIGPRDLTATNKDALGGNYFAVAHLESDFPVGLPEEYGITGGAFVDVGSVWGLDNTAGTGGTVDDSLRLRSTIGFSVFWNTAIGPLRFNFTHALKKESYDKEQTFDFAISTKF